MIKEFLPILFLSFFSILSSEVEGKVKKCQIDRGAIVKGNSETPHICLVFTASEWADGAESILNTLKEEHISGAFFFTGKFFEKYADIVHRIVNDKHYVGSHSYGHPLYSSWEKPDSMLITQQEFEEDLLHSYKLMKKLGIPRKKAPYFLPPFEHHNETIAEWTKKLNLTLINITKGSGSAADYTIPSMTNYRSSQQIFENILKYESKHTLNGHLLCFHLGTHPDRTDKFYYILPQLIHFLKEKGYSFITLDKICQE